MNSKPSKSAKKRENQALQNLGEQLIELSPEQLSAMGLDDRLSEAVIAARSMRAHGALRRQKQLIGKLMREIDPAPIVAALDQFGSSERADKQIFRHAEQWRDKLTSGDDTSVDAYADTLGVSVEAIRKVVSRWAGASDDRARRTASREIFRQVHRDLRATKQNTESR